MKLINQVQKNFLQNKDRWSKYKNEFTKFINYSLRKALKDMLDNISKELRKEFEEKIIERSVEKIVGQNETKIRKEAIKELLK